MEKRYFADSELIINGDGSVFHLHVKPEQLADKVILVGDPARVSLVASMLDDIEFEAHNREFRTVTGTYRGAASNGNIGAASNGNIGEAADGNVGEAADGKAAGKRITVVSTGIGCDNVDIVLNELDALANIDFETRRERDTLRQLEIVRVGTCGGLQDFTPIGSMVCSVRSVGFDGLLNFYSGRNDVCDLAMERALISHLGWQGNMCQPHPYVIAADSALANRIAGGDMVRGVTVACGGFYGPQGRQLRIPLADPQQNEKIESFEYDGLKITNFEMESSAVAGLSRLLGHKAVTCCLVIANRKAKVAQTGYRNEISDLIRLVLDRI